MLRLCRGVDPEMEQKVRGEIEKIRRKKPKKPRKVEKTISPKPVEHMSTTDGSSSSDEEGEITKSPAPNYDDSSSSEEFEGKIDALHPFKYLLFLPNSKSASMHPTNLHSDLLQQTMMICQIF
jgi:hypothetical protein